MHLKLRHIVALSQLENKKETTLELHIVNLRVIVQFAFKLGYLLGRVRLCGNQNCTF